MTPTLVRRGLPCVALVGACLLAGPAVAEPLTLTQAIERAEEVSPDVHRQELSSEAAEAQWLADPEAGAPQIRLGVRDLDVATNDEPQPRDPRWTARLRFPFPRPWDLATARRQGQATVEREDAQLDGIKAQLREAVTRRFHSLPLARKALVTARALTALRSKHADQVAAQRAEGAATALDWLESEEDRRDAADREARLASGVHALEAELRMMLDWPIGEPLELVEVDHGARLEAALPDVDALLDGMSERDPQVREAEAEIARAEARLERLKLRALPWLDWAQAGASFEKENPVSFDVSIAIDVPIYRWGAARTKAASQELTRARLDLSEARSRTEKQLAARLRSLEAARQRWEVEKEHEAAVRSTVEPLLELADALMKIELESRLRRAELRVLSALAEMVEQLDRLDAEAFR